MAVWSFAYVTPVLSAALAGGLIGFEREYRGHPAGLRTHMLVCLASALLMLAATHQADWFGGTFPPDVIRIDPVRMAHGVLTGIGFLCGGVIFRQGLSVHGLTTAASLWITAALGLLFGVGVYGLAVGGTVATLAVLAALRWVDQRLPHAGMVDIRVRYHREGGFPEPEFHALMDGLGLRPKTISHRLISAGDSIELGASLRGPTPDQTRTLAERLCDDPRIVSFEIQPRDD